MEEIKDKIILAVKKAITNRAEVVDCYHDIMEIDSNDVDHIAEQVADALISANIGDVAAWKERAEKHRVQVLPDGTLKQLYGDEEVEQIVKERDSKEEAYNKCYFDYRYWKDKAKEYKHRSEVAEGRLEKLKKTDGDLTIEDEIDMLENTVEEARHRSFVFERELVKYKIAFDKAIKLAYKIRTDLDVLSCSSCEFGHAIDVCKKTGLYSDCENRWKEELLQQAQRELTEEKI